MRKIIIVAVSFFCILSFSVPAYCGCGCQKRCPAAAPQNDSETCPDGNALQKLGRGACNCITFPFEIPMQMGKTHETDGPFAGWTYGLLKGVGMAGVRAAVGIYEVATFPIPCPAGYQPILTNPEYMFEDQTW